MFCTKTPIKKTLSHPVGIEYNEVKVEVGGVPCHYSDPYLEMEVLAFVSGLGTGGEFHFSLLPRNNKLS